MAVQSCVEKTVIFVNVIVLYLLLLSSSNVPSLVLSKPFKSTDTGLHRDESTLPINVRNNGGEVFREVIRSNVNENWIGIEFRETDGSLVKQIIDFRNKLQLFSLTRLGEQDLGERRVQTFCFLTSLPEHEYISAESMSQLTQRNPAAIRQAEFDSGTIQLGMDVEIVPADNKHGHASFALLSEHIDVHCGTGANSDARVYGTENDLRKWALQNGKQNFVNLTEALRPLDSWNRKPDSVVGGSQAGASSSPPRIASSTGSSSLSGSSVAPKLVPNNSDRNAANIFDSNLSNSVVPTFSSVTSRRCGDILHSIYRNLTSTSGETSIDFRLASKFATTSNTAGGKNTRGKAAIATSEKLCQCSMSLVIPFYPCDIKYCTAQDPKDPQKINRFRCGIKTCRRRYDFLFTVSDKLSCLSSFDPTVPNDQHTQSNSFTHLDDENEIIHHSDLNSEQKSDILQNN